MKVPYTHPDYLAKAEAAWRAAVRLQQFCYANISYEVMTSRSHAMHLVLEWEKAGKVRRLDRLAGVRKKLHFEVIPEGEIRVAPMVGDIYEQMWTSMRKMAGFSPADLVATCSLPLTIEEASSYCRLLLTGNYLKVVQKAIPPHKAAIYRLINITGVRAPRARRLVCIVDPNVGTSAPISEVRA